MTSKPVVKSQFDFETRERYRESMVDFSDIGKTLDERDKKNSKSLLEVCRCGHSARSHREVREPGKYQKEQCKVGSIRCNCTGYSAIIQVPTVKYFRYSTSGSGKDHPLILGWAKTQREAEGEIVALTDYRCAVTECTSNERVWPVMWDTKLNDVAGLRDSGVTQFICTDHLLANGLGHILP